MGKEPITSNYEKSRQTVKENGEKAPHNAEH